MKTTLAIAAILSFIGFCITTTLSLYNKKFDKIANNYITFYLLGLLIIIIISLILK